MVKRFDTRALKRPLELSIDLPPGDFDPVIQVLASRAMRLAGLQEGQAKEIARAVTDVAGQAGRAAALRVRFVFTKPQVLIGLSTAADGVEPADGLLSAWERKRAGRLMDEARMVGEAGTRELLLVKSLS